MQRVLAVLVLAGLLHGAASAADAVLWRQDTEQAADDAKARGRLLMVFVTGPDT